MRTKNTLLNISFIILFVLITSLSGQWEDDKRLTFDSAQSRLSWFNEWSVSASGNTVHTVWYDNRSLNWEIYYKRSLDNGTTWGPDIPFTDTFGMYPSIASEGSNVHVVWDGDVDAQYGPEVWYTRSMDNGTTWEPFQMISQMNGGARASIVSSGSDVYAVWKGTGYSPIEIFFRHSPDNGATWDSIIQVSYGAVLDTSHGPNIAVSPPYVHIV